MSEPQGFGPELRISLHWVVVLLSLAGWLTVVAPHPLTARASVAPMGIGVTVQLLALLAFWLDRRVTLLARPLALATLAVWIVFASTWWALPGFLTLLVVPVILAAALIGYPAAPLTAAGDTALLLAAVLLGVVSLPAVVVPLVVIWIAAGSLSAVYGPVRLVTGWSWQYYMQAQRSLDEARDRKADLEQALEDLVHANDQLTRLNALAQELRQAAVDARIAKEQFVANVSHELRTPLNMIIGFSEMILAVPETYGSRLPSALLADLDVIHRNADHLSNLIDDVLDLSQIEAEQMALTKEYVALPEVVEEAVTSVQPLFASKSLYLTTALQEGLPPVLCDRTRIREVLLNLLSNAGRFTEQGGVQVIAAHQEDEVVISVRDTGPGIAPGDMSKIFQPFQQLDGTIRRRYGGTGLGLSISKRFVELHGGKIWVETSAGNGTAFHFCLPLVLSEPLAGGPARWLAPEWEYFQRTRPSVAPKSVVRPRFLLVDHEHALGRLLLRYLGDAEIVQVASLEEARRDLARLPARAVLINGSSVSEELSRLNPADLPEGTPALICSIPGAQDASASLGASDVLVKPIAREALLGALDRLGLSEGTVLIVDDEPDALHLFGRMLAASGRGYRVLLARDGREALAVLQECRPDLILLDLVMPELDGFQLLEQRRHDPQLQEVPVIVISARDPAGRPIVSNALAVTRRGGLSLHDLLSSIEALSKGVGGATGGRPGDPALPAEPSA